MESSTVVAFRALVLVACLIVVPLAAIFGSQFPDVVKSVLIDRIFPNGVPGMAREPSRDTAPPFGATNEATPWQAGQSARWRGQPRPEPDNRPPARRRPGRARESNRPWPGIKLRGQVRPAAGEGPAGGQPGGAERTGRRRAGRPAAEASGSPNQGPAHRGATGPAVMPGVQCAFGGRSRSLHADGAAVAGAGGDLLFARDVGKRERILSLSLQNGDRQQSDPHAAIRGHRRRSVASDGPRGRAGRSLAHGPTSLASLPGPAWHLTATCRAALAEPLVQSLRLAIVPILRFRRLAGRWGRRLCEAPATNHREGHAPLAANPLLGLR